MAELSSWKTAATADTAHHPWRSRDTRPKTHTAVVAPGPAQGGGRLYKEGALLLLFSRWVPSDSYATPVDCSPPGSSVHRISQAGTLEWVAISSSRGPPRPRDQTPPTSPALAGGFSTTEPPGKPTEKGEDT